MDELVHVNTFVYLYIGTVYQELGEGELNELVEILDAEILQRCSDHFID